MLRRTRQRSPGTRTQRGRTRSRVEALDVVREVLLHDAATELQRRRQLTVLLREIAREDRKALDLLDAYAVAVDLVDDLLDELLRVAARGVHFRLVERDQGGDVRAAV